MPSGRENLPGSERRAQLLAMLQKNRDPITASSLAKIFGVTRQVIVQDVSLLRAQNQSVFSTRHGYILQHPSADGQIRQVIYCRHTLEDTAKELNTLVDHGVTVENVGIDHSVYGKIFQPLSIKNRLDVHQFLQDILQSDASLLSSLTNGLHFHTITGSNIDALNCACRQLKSLGILIPE
ncbi:MAG: transcription repressor NadR [Peptococcaceae bacterium]|jgi:transcriptional regulator of NAD metabolism|nr:transcription repressor NadR [Peptococcaceae bacterium]